MSSSRFLSFARHRPLKIAVDTLLFIGFVAEFVTREGPDYLVHSWVGIVLVPVVVVHLAGNIGWIRRVLSQGRADREFSLGVLNAVLGFLTSVCIVTGFPIWLDWSTSPALTTVHTATGLLSIVLMFAHLYRNRSRVRRLLAANKPA